MAYTPEWSDLCFVNPSGEIVAYPGYPPDFTPTRKVLVVSNDRYRTIFELPDDSLSLDDLQALCDFVDMRYGVLADSFRCHPDTHARVVAMLEADPRSQADSNWAIPDPKFNHRTIVVTTSPKGRFPR